MKQIILPMLLAAASPMVFAAVEKPDMAIICIGCHGQDGNSEATHYPKLAGQGKNYLSKQLTDFKAGRRREQHMDSMVEAISMDDIPKLSAWFESQPRKRLSRPVNPQGKQIYQFGIEPKGIAACAGCHGEQGMGNDAIGFPSLAGQHAEYISKQLKDFRQGHRSNDSMMMQAVARGLTDSEIEAVANYIEGM